MCIHIIIYGDNMSNITLSLPDEIYSKMKKHKEIKWSEVARKAIIEYLNKIESKSEYSTKDLLKELGDDFKRDIENIDIDKYEGHYEKMREKEWKRTYTTQTNL